MHTSKYVCVCVPTLLTLMCAHVVACASQFDVPEAVVPARPLLCRVFRAMKRFALKNPYADVTVGEKRPAGAIDDPATPKKTKKAPSAASLVVMDSVARPKPQKLPTAAPLNVAGALRH